MAVLFLYCSFRLPQTYTLLTSFGSKKEEPKCYCPSKSPENEPPTESLTGPLWRLYNLSRAFIYTYNHSPTYDHPTYKNPNLRSIFPKENFDSRPTEFATETPLRKFQFKLLRKRYLFNFELNCYISLKKLRHFYFATSVLLNWSPLDLLEGVHFTQLIYFRLTIKSIQYQVFRKFHVRKPDSTCNCTN